MPRHVRFGWLPITQLLLSALLLAAGTWAYFSDHYMQRAVRSEVTVPFTVRARSLPFALPSGGKTIFPQQKLVALYGAPGAPVLGALGQQDMQASIVRVKQLSAAYQPYSQAKILPTFEIIATVASESPTENNDYSKELSQKTLQTWITAARNAGIYVVLDIQPGRTDFLTQARQLTPLLSQPNVGLALDPEWRLKPNQIPLVQIGSVSIQEVNATANWLASLTRRNNLPQKLFLLHQFRNDMVVGRAQLNISHPELAYAIQMDGQGTQAQKQDTWRAILRQAPANTTFGWKNFYKKDTTLLTPAQTMAIKPQPWYVSYQ